MNDVIENLYQSTILDHNASPRNTGKIKDYTNKAFGNNPICGDTLFLYLHLDFNVIKNISFVAQGCAICKASSSMMSQVIKGQTIEKAQEIFTLFHSLLTHREENNNLSSKLGKLVVFAGVRNFPLRVKCATLPWHTFKAALKNQSQEITTE